nr:hypothetical protein [Tanacetum cinerariifolium]
MNPLTPRWSLSRSSSRKRDDVDCRSSKRYGVKGVAVPLPGVAALCSSSRLVDGTTSA